VGAPIAASALFAQFLPNVPIMNPRQIKPQMIKAVIWNFVMPIDCIGSSFLVFDIL